MRDDCCIFNDGIVCYTRKPSNCEKCGWNPAVIKLRAMDEEKQKKCKHVLVVYGYKHKDGKLHARLRCEKCGYRTLAEIKV